MPSATASATLVRCPPDSVPTFAVSGTLARATSSSAYAWSQPGFEFLPNLSVSATVICGYSGFCCVRYDTAGCMPRPFGVSPNTSIRPVVGRNNPVTNPMNVLLPAPFGPTSATTRPAGTSSAHSRNAHPRGYFFPSASARTGSCSSVMRPP